MSSVTLVAADREGMDETEVPSLSSSTGLEVDDKAELPAAELLSVRSRAMLPTREGSGLSNRPKTSSHMRDAFCASWDSPSVLCAVG